jgi:uncharacterized protein
MYDFPKDLSPGAMAVMLLGLAVGAFARGYSGFGFSAILVSSWALVTDPAKAVVVALCLEVSASIMQAISVWKDVPWKRVALLMAGAVIGTPIGVMVLASAPPEPLKLAIAVFVLISAALLYRGLSFKTKASAASTAAVGVASGLANGSVGMGGLPVALFLAADADTPKRIRAAVIAYFFLLDLTGLAFQAQRKLVTGETLTIALLSLPILALGVWLGGRRFLGTTPDAFRRSTLILLMVIAVLGVGRALLGPELGHSKKQDGGRGDVINRGSAREIGHRFGKALENGTNGASQAQLLDELIGDVAGIQIGKDQNVGAARHVAFAAQLAGGNIRIERRVGLEFAINEELGRADLCQARSFSSLPGIRMMGAAVGREGEERDARRLGQERPGRVSRCDGDIGKLGGGRLRIDRAVGEDQAAILQLHQEER